MGDIGEAIRSDSVAAVKEYLSAGPDRLNDQYAIRDYRDCYTLLGYASTHGALNIVEFLTKQENIDIDCGRYYYVSLEEVLELETPLDLALSSGHEKIASCLIKKQATCKTQHHLLQEFLAKRREESVPLYNLVSLLSINSNEATEIQDCMEQTNKESTRTAMLLGKLTLGSSPNLKWSSYLNILTEMPSTMKKKQALIQEQKNRIDTANARHEALALQIEEMKREQQTLKQEVSDLEESIEESTKILDIWEAFREEKLPTVMQSVQSAAEVEQKLANDLMAQIKKDPSALAALSDDQSENPKLSLVFNMAGLTEDVITKLSSVSGEEFLLLTSLRGSDYDLGFHEQKDLEYCRTMLDCGQFPYESHKDQCVVCCCETEEELWNLLDEHSDDIDVSVLNLEMLKSHSITGPRALVLTRADMKSPLNCGTETKITKAIRIVLYLQRLHRDSLKN